MTREQTLEERIKKLQYLADNGLIDFDPYELLEKLNESLDIIKDLQSSLDRLEEENRKLKENKWQPIETAPKGGNVEILVYRGDKSFEIQDVQIESSSNSRFYDWNGFTNWMPLPEFNQLNKYNDK